MINEIISASALVITALIGLGGIIVKYYLNHREQKNKVFSENISLLLTKKVINPFHTTIGMSIYKKIISENEKIICPNQMKIQYALKSLKNLQSEIESDSLIFEQMNDIFLRNLATVIISMEEESDMKKINRDFHAFSATYFQLINKIRKSNFLPQRGDNYRVTFNLYKQKNAKNFMRKRSFDSFLSKTILTIVFSTAIPFLLVSIAHLIIAIYELFVLLY